MEIDSPEDAVFAKSVPLKSGIWKTFGTLIPSLSLIPLIFAAGNVEPVNPYDAESGLTDQAPCDISSGSSPAGRQTIPR
jgi:hypothetical protein